MSTKAIRELIAWSKRGNEIPSDIDARALAEVEAIEAMARKEVDYGGDADTAALLESIARNAP